MISEKSTSQKKTKQNISVCCQPQTKTTSGNSNSNMKINETTESTPPTEGNAVSIPTTSTLIPGIPKTLQVPTKTIRRNCDIYKDPNISEKSASEHIAIAHHFQFQETAKLPFLQFKRPNVLTIY